MGYDTYIGNCQVDLVGSGEECHTDEMARHTPSNVNEKRVAEDKKPLIIDPRQTQAIWNYKDPSSPTFANLKQSLISAGYDERYADTIYDRKPLWLTDNMQSTIAMVERAEKNLKRSIDMDIDLDNPSKTAIELLKIQMDSSKFTLKTLARSKYEPESEKADTNIQVNIIKQGKSIDVEAKEV